MMEDYRKKLLGLGFKLVWHRINLSNGGSVEVCSPPYLQLTVPNSTSSSTSPTVLPDWAIECFPDSDKEPAPKTVWVYPPVTGDEAWWYAKKVGAFPITTAVADQVHRHKNSHSVTYAPWPGNKLKGRAAGGPGKRNFWSFNFIGYGHILTKTKYRSFGRTKLVSGAHKLWILHNHN